MNNKTWLSLIGILFAIDQATKIVVINFIPNLLVKNYGSAFSLPIPVLFTVLLTILFAGLVFWLKYTNKIEYPAVWALALGGAFGNFVDRVSLGYVIDFINLGFFPVFNFADVFLTVAAILLVYEYILKDYIDGKLRTKP